MNAHPTKVILDVCYEKHIVADFYLELETLLNQVVKLCSFSSEEKF